MTIPEREQLQAFLLDFLQPAVERIDGRLEGIETRIGSLETTRAQEEAVRADRRQRDAKQTDKFRWQLATAFTGGGLVMSFLYYTHLLGHL